jgi:hypothetical protein
MNDLNGLLVASEMYLEDMHSSFHLKLRSIFFSFLDSSKLFTFTILHDFSFNSSTGKRRRNVLSKDTFPTHPKS